MPVKGGGAELNGMLRYLQKKKNGVEKRNRRGIQGEGK